MRKNLMVSIGILLIALIIVGISACHNDRNNNPSVSEQQVNMAIKNGHDKTMAGNKITTTVTTTKTDASSGDSIYVWTTTTTIDSMTTFEQKKVPINDLNVDIPENRTIKTVQIDRRCKCDPNFEASFRCANANSK